MDSLVFVLQIVMLAILIEQQNWKDGTISTLSVPPAGAATGQDHDAEERGVIGSENEIELQTMVRSAGRTGGEEDGERDQLLAEPSESQLSPNAHPLDSFYSGGETVLCNLHLLNAIKSQWGAAASAQGATTGSTTGSNSIFTFPGGRLAIRMRVGGREIATG